MKSIVRFVRELFSMQKLMPSFDPDERTSPAPSASSLDETLKEILQSAVPVRRAPKPSETVGSRLATIQRE